MSHLLNQVVREENGVLKFEWILLLTVLVIGIVGGLSSVRDAYNDEMASTSKAITSLDLSYFINDPIHVLITVYDYEGKVTQIENHLSGTAYGSLYIQDMATITEQRPAWDISDAITAAGRDPEDFKDAWSVEHTVTQETYGGGQGGPKKNDDDYG